jgi:SsrA-binding protein
MSILNKKAQFNYRLFERFEAGISLLGGEVKAIRLGRADLSNSYVRIINNEAFLLNASIPIAGKKDYSPTRSRKLLLHKSQIISLKSKIEAKKLTLVPTKLYTKGRNIKLEIAIAKAKRSFEKKESLKKKDIAREIKREIDSRLKFETLSTKY